MRISDWSSDVCSSDLFGGARLRPHHTRGHLCPRLPADRGGAAVRRDAVAAEDPPRRNDRTVSSMAASDPVRPELVEGPFFFHSPAKDGASTSSARMEVDRKSLV